MLLFIGRDAEGPSTPIRQLYGVFRRPANGTDLYVQQLLSRDMDFELDEEDEPPLTSPRHSAHSWEPRFTTMRA